MNLTKGSIKKLFTPIYILLFILLAVSIYFHIIDDIFLVLLLFLTAFSIGTFIPVKGNMKFLDKFLICLAVGLAITGFLIWLSTFRNFGYTYVFLILSIIIIAARYKHTLKSLKQLKKELSMINNNNKLLFPLIIIFFILYLIAASYPILQFDAVAHHVAVPFQILQKTNWDYNVIEFLGYGCYSILAHLYYLYLMALGGTKALVLFNVFMSFGILFLLLRMSMLITKSNLVHNSITLIYLTTPMIFFLSTTLYIDLIPLFFVFAALLIVCYLDIKTVVSNIFIISFLLGSSLFVKMTALYHIIPLALLLIIYLIVSFIKKNISLFQFITKSFGSLVLFLLPFAPSMLIVWHKTGNPVCPFFNGIFKSIYFSPYNFVDPFNGNPLGLNVHSIISMVFHTSNNVEFIDGGLGFFLLLLFLVPLVFLFKRHRTYVLLFIFTVFSYFLSVQSAYYIRYMMGHVIISILLCSFVFWVLLRLFVKFIKSKITSIILVYFLILLLLTPNIILTFGTDYVYCFKKDMLKPNHNLTLNLNEGILSSINNKEVRLLSNNDVFRGTFKGDFYTLDWYNSFFVDKLNNKEISSVDFLTSFDYYLVCKWNRLSPYLPEEMFSLNNTEIREQLTLINETESHILYKINRNSTFLDKELEIYYKKWPHLAE